METISFGTLGDSFIAYLKLLNMKSDHHHFITDDEKTFSLIHQWLEYPDFVVPCDVLVEYSYAYLECVKMNVWADKQEIKYVWTHDERQNMNPYVDFSHKPKRYDVCIQVNSFDDDRRNWQFDPLSLKDRLERDGYKVCLVGWNNDHKPQGTNDFVNKTTICECIDLVRSCEVMVSNLGFHSLVKLAARGKVVYFTGNVNSEDYVHNDWKNHSRDLVTPSLEETWIQTKNLLTT